MIDKVYGILGYAWKFVASWAMLIRTMILIAGVCVGAIVFAKVKTTIKAVPVAIPASTQCDWLIQQNKELISFITSPRSRNRRSLDSLVQMDSIKKERAGISSP